VCTGELVVAVDFRVGRSTDGDGVTRPSGRPVFPRWILAFINQRDTRISLLGSFFIHSSPYTQPLEEYESHRGRKRWRRRRWCACER
jgi:hypothetical protein